MDSRKVDGYDNTTKIKLNFSNIYQMKRYNIARRYDSNNVILEFDSRTKLFNTDGLYTFLVYRRSVDDEAKYLPIINGKIELGPEFTSYPGEINCQVIVKTSDAQDGSTGFLRSSEIFKLTLGNVIWTNEELEDQPIEPSLQLVYEEMLKKIDELNDMLLNGEFTPEISDKGTWVINDVDTGKLAIGKSPKIDESTGNWLIFNEETMEYEDSGVPANGGNDIILQFNSYLEFPTIGQSEHKLYLDKSDNTCYRWDDIDKKYYLVSISKIDIIDGGSL